MFKRYLLLFLLAVFPPLFLPAGSARAGASAWQAKRRLPSPMDVESLFVINSRIYLVCPGDLARGAAGGILVYDPEGDRWETKAVMPVVKAEFGAAVHGDKIYTVGGLTADGSRSATMETYDPETDKWETKPGMSAARNVPGVLVHDHKLYVIGGWSIGSEGGCNAAEEYDFATNTWRRLSDVPRGTAYSYITVINEKIYLFGGYDKLNGGFQDLIQIYDLKNDTWTISSQKIPVDTLRGATVNDTVYIFSALAPRVIAYSPALDVCRNKARIPAPCGDPDLIAHNGKVFLIGGWLDGTAVSNQVGCYDPASDTWTELPGLARGKWGCGAAVVKNKLYVIGGRLGSWGRGTRPPLDDAVEELDLAGY